MTRMNKMEKTLAGSSAVFKAAFLILMLALILLLAGFVTPNWTEVEIENFMTSKRGLWKTCKVVGNIGEQCLDTIYRGEGWYMVAQTFEALGLICFIIVLVMSLMLLVAISNPRLARVNVYTGVFAGIFILIATATYTYNTEIEEIGYSCWLSWMSAVCIVIAVTLLECARQKTYRQEEVVVQTDVIPEEIHGYHSYPMQELSPKLKRANPPLVIQTEIKSSPEP